MTEETEVPELPIEQRIAKLVAQDSIEKILDEDKLEKGACTVELSVTNELPEFTPSDFMPHNDLEEYLFQNKTAGSMSLTLPFSFKLNDMVAGLRINVTTLERKYNCEQQVTLDPIGKQTLQIELQSHTLQRSLYIKLTPQPGS